MEQGSAADVAMCAMLQIFKNERLRELGWKLLLQVSSWMEPLFGLRRKYFFGYPLAFKTWLIFWEQVHDEVILEGPSESAEEAKAIVVNCMSKPFFDGENILRVELSVDANCAQNWYAAKWWDGGYLTPRMEIQSSSGNMIPAMYSCNSMIYSHRFSFFPVGCWGSRVCVAYWIDHVQSWIFMTTTTLKHI